ncbi:MAG: tetratricopeptide repeat protein [Treponema sp.]|nr:tetratricopeptide repeat protein [Treponema sp.]
MVSLIIIAVMVVGIGFLVVFVVKSLMQPKKIDGIKKLVKQGKYARAEKLAKAIIQKDPRDYLARYYLGRAYLAEHKNELALMEYKSVGQNAIFGPQIPEASFRTQLADLYMKFNQLEDAQKEYLLLTKLEPTNAEHFFNAGKIYEQLGHADTAMGFYQKTLQLNKKHVKAHAAMGLLLFRGKDMRGAQQEINTAIQLSPETFSSYYYLGKILKESKDLPGAVKAFEKAVRDPEYKQKALLEKGSCFMLANAPDKAVAEFERAIKASKNDHAQETLFARYFLAACHEKSRNIDKAIEQWQLIMQANKNFKDVASKLSQYKELQANDSIKEYMTCGQEDLVEICKKAAAAMNFANAQLKQDHLEDARANYQKFIEMDSENEQRPAIEQLIALLDAEILRRANEKPELITPEDMNVGNQDMQIPEDIEKIAMEELPAQEPKKVEVEETPEKISMDEVAAPELPPEELRIETAESERVSVENDIPAEEEKPKSAQEVVEETVIHEAQKDILEAEEAARRQREQEKTIEEEIEIPVLPDANPKLEEEPKVLERIQFREPPAPQKPAAKKPVADLPVPDASVSEMPAAEEKETPVTDAK